MLTKTDFSQIRKIVREEVESESKSLEEELTTEVKLSRIELQKEIRPIQDKIKNLDLGIRKIQKDLKLILNFFDKEYLGLRKRVEKIEEQLPVSPAQ